VRNDVIREVLIPKVRLKFSHVLKVIGMQYLDCQQILYCRERMCVCVCVCVCVCIVGLIRTVWVKTGEQ